LKFVGIDLAWGEEKPSGVAIVGGGGTVERARADLWTNADICDFAGLASPEGAVVAIDAPLVVREYASAGPSSGSLRKYFGPATRRHTPPICPIRHSRRVDAFEHW